VPSPSLSEVDTERCWNDYLLHIDLYKHYLRLSLELNLFYYAVTGAFISFYFSRPASDRPLLRYSLLLPIAMSFLFACFFLYDAKLHTITRKAVINLRIQLNLGTEPEMNVLTSLLVIWTILFLIVGTFLLAVLLWTPGWNLYPFMSNR